MKDAKYYLLVPKEEMADAHDQGTAFVARKSGDTYLVHYEAPGQASNIVTFEDRIRHAAGRLHDSYPTSKMMGGTDEHWHQVGTVIYRSDTGWTIEDISDLDALSQWDPGPHYAGGSPALHEEGRIRRINEDIKSGRIKAPWKT